MDTQITLSRCKSVFPCTYISSMTSHFLFLNSLVSKLTKKNKTTNRQTKKIISGHIYKMSQVLPTIDGLFFKKNLVIIPFKI